MGTASRNWFLIVICALLVSCSDTPTYAPVYDIADIEPIISRYSALPVHTQAARQPTSKLAWQTPVDLQNTHTYTRANKGVDITGNAGEPIYAAAAGKVVYCGSGLRGYGNLIIIKHSADYLTIYAHAQQLQVKQGEWVNAGQTIASMGNTGSNSVKLHFEIRHLGQPIDPLILLPTKSV